MSCGGGAEFGVEHYDVLNVEGALAYHVFLSETLFPQMEVAMKGVVDDFIQYGRRCTDTVAYGETVEIADAQCAKMPPTPRQRRRRLMQTCLRPRRSSLASQPLTCRSLWGRSRRRSTQRRFSSGSCRRRSERRWCSRVCLQLRGKISEGK